MERNFSYKVFKDGFEIDGEAITREDAKNMMLAYYAKTEDVEKILNTEVA